MTVPAPNDTRRSRPFHKVARVFCLILAALFVLLASAGVLIPGLPTTPFLLLASYFLVRSSPRLNARLLRSKLFGPILIDWQEHGGVRRDVKVKAVSGVILAVVLTIHLSNSVQQSIIVGLMASVGIAVILRVPVAKPGGTEEQVGAANGESVTKASCSHCSGKNHQEA